MFLKLCEWIDSIDEPLFIFLMFIAMMMLLSLRRKEAM